jgi:hypothetical protein
MTYVHNGPDIEFLDHGGTARRARLNADGAFVVSDGESEQVWAELPIQFPDGVPEKALGCDFFVKVSGAASSTGPTFLIRSAGTIPSQFPSFPPRDGRTDSIESPSLIWKAPDYGARYARLDASLNWVALYVPGNTIDYGELRYGDAVSKSSHNSYDDAKPSYGEQYDWNSERPWVGGCRSFELDLAWLGAGWVVTHQLAGHAGMPTIESRLQRIKDQVRAFGPYHDVVTVFLEVKRTDRSDVYANIEECILRVFSRSTIFTAGEMLGNYGDLVTAADNRNWPTLNDLRGKFIFVVGKIEGVRHTKYDDYLDSSSVVFWMTGWTGDLAERNAVFRNIDAESAKEAELTRAWRRSSNQLLRSYYTDHQPNLFNQWLGMHKLSFLAVDRTNDDQGTEYYVGGNPYIAI